MHRFKNLKITLLVIFFTISLSFSDEIYNVPIASSDNTIELTIHNNTPTNLINVVVSPQNIPEWLIIESLKSEINQLDADKEEDALFKFSLTNSAPLGKNQILKFEITSTNGQTWSESIEIKVSAPEEFKLLQNYPNPFNPETKIGYLLPQNGEITINIYNSLGQRVDKIATSKLSAGYHETIWNGSHFSSGTYFIQIKYEDEKMKTVIQNKKMLLLK